MDERRGEPAAPGSHPPIASAGSALPPIQQAYGHFTRCTDCRDIDQRCDTGEQLHQTWRELSEAALDQIADKTN